MFEWVDESGGPALPGTPGIPPGVGLDQGPPLPSSFLV